MRSSAVDESQHLREPANTALDIAFRHRDRHRCSKRDFASGFIAAL